MERLSERSGLTGGVVKGVLIILITVVFSIALLAPPVSAGDTPYDWKPVYMAAPQSDLRIQDGDPWGNDRRGVGNKSTFDDFLYLSFSKYIANFWVVLVIETPTVVEKNEQPDNKPVESSRNSSKQ